MEIRSAKHIWGLGAIKTEEVLKGELGDEFQIATIGPAGENGVVFACINHDFGRQAGRCGMGAVMGSKNLKAIAVRGTQSVPVADMEGLKNVSTVMFRELLNDPGLKIWQDLGLAQVTTWANSIAALPTRNFRENFYEDVEGLSGELMKETIVVGDKACLPVPWLPGIMQSQFPGRQSLEGPEYETTALIGSNCALRSIEEVAFGIMSAMSLALILFLQAML